MSIESRIEGVGLFAPDVLLPEQMFGKRVEITPELKLLEAVFFEAIRCLNGNKDRPKREAEEWLEAKNHDYGSFLMLCESFGLEPDKTRERLQSAAVKSPRMATVIANTMNRGEYAARKVA